MRFWGYVPNSLRNKNMERHIPYLLNKMVFCGLQNSPVPLGRRGKKLSSTLNVMILQMMRNECIRFGYLDIEVSYKILRLDVLKETPVLHNLALNRGWFEAVLNFRG
jgi:hypothetical protein